MINLMERFKMIENYRKIVTDKVRELELQVCSYVGRDAEYDELKLKLEFAKGELNTFLVLDEFMSNDIVKREGFND